MILFSDVYRIWQVCPGYGGYMCLQFRLRTLFFNFTGQNKWIIKREDLRLMPSFLSFDFFLLLLLPLCSWILSLLLSSRDVRAQIEEEKGRECLTRVRIEISKISTVKFLIIQAMLLPRVRFP